MRSCPVQILITGDLALYATAWGEINMIGNWCTWCQLSPKVWLNISHKKGEEWTNIKKLCCFGGYI